MLFFILDIESPDIIKASKTSQKKKIEYKLKRINKEKIKAIQPCNNPSICKKIKARKDQRKKDIVEIYKLYYEELLAYCDAHVGSMEDAEEIVQDVFVLFLKKYSAAQKKSSRSWLYKTAYFFIKNYKDKKENREKILIAVSYSDVNDAEYNYTFTYTEDLFRILRNALSVQEFEFFIKYFVESTDNEKNGKNKGESITPLANSIKIKKCRLKKKILDILKDEEIIV